MESMPTNEFKIGGQLDESQRMATIESIISNRSDSVRYCNPLQGFATIESIFPDASSGRMKNDFRGIWRGLLILETPISVDGQREIWNVLHWQVSTEADTIFPTSIFINPRDCEGPSLYRESEFIHVPSFVHVPWVDYHVVMFKFHIYTVGIAFRNVYHNHGYRCNSWILLLGLGIGNK